MEIDGIVSTEVDRGLQTWNNLSLHLPSLITKLLDLDARKDIPAQSNTITHLSSKHWSSSGDSESKERSSMKAFKGGVEESWPLQTFSITTFMPERKRIIEYSRTCKVVENGAYKIYKKFHIYTMGLN